MKKREPLLCDRLIAYSDQAGYLLGKKYSAIVKANLLQAKRFVLDKEAARYIGEMIREFPRIIADGQDFAIAPFPKTWIEIPFDELFMAVNPGGKLDLADPTRDLRIGFLYVGNTVFVATFSYEPGLPQAAWMPIQYHLWKPFTLQEQVRMADLLEVSRAGLDTVYWGSSYLKLLNDADKEGLRALRENHSFSPLGEAVKYHGEKHTLQVVLSESAGDVRNIIAFLLFLNRTRDIQRVDEVPFKQAMIGSKAGVLLKHSVITIHVNPQPRFQKMVAGHSVWRRLHNVRGHYCHDEQARAGCLHGAVLADLKDFGDEWVEYEPLRWYCQLCKGKRWWRKMHRRGHEEKGEVTSEYKVTE